MSPSLKVLELGTLPHERGLVHGRAMQAAIRSNIEAYLLRFESGGATRQAVMRQGDLWADQIAGDNAAYFEEMMGVAEGASCPLNEIAMLNARYEIAYCLFGEEARRLNRVAEQEGCTSFGLMPEVTRDGHTLIGQNWDWLESIAGKVFIQRVKRSDRPGEGQPSFVGFTEAGVVGCKMGVNAAGIGLCVNGLVTTEDGRNGLRKPFHVRCREILDAWTFDKALLPIVQTDRTCSANFLIGHADGEIIDIEATPNNCAYLYPRDGIVTHANHLVQKTDTRSHMERLGPHSLYRAVRLERNLRRSAGDIGMEAIRTGLTDHFSAPNAICRHPDSALAKPARVITVAAVVIDLNARELYASNGQPCQAELVRFMLAADSVTTDVA